MKSKGFLSFTIKGRPRPYIMAHRGNRVACPENTLAAFKRAIDDGADILETDLHLTADREFVCMHDDTVDRTTNGSGVIAEMTLDQIKALHAGYGREGFESERVPTLSETAVLVPEHVILAFELKSDRFLEPEICELLIRELDRSGIRDRTILLSFSVPRLRAVQAVARNIPVGWITLSCPWPIKNVQLLGPYWPLLLINPFYVWLAHLRGQTVCPLDSSPDTRMWLYRLFGVDAILTDDPGTTISTRQKQG